MTLRKWIPLTLISLPLAGCVTPQLPADPHLLDVLQDGHTPKETALLKFGQPSAVFESGRILTYRLGKELERGYFIRQATATNWLGVSFSLVLVFDEHEVLQRHSLVPVR